jgi:hypothetical protein
MKGRRGISIVVMARDDRDFGLGSSSAGGQGHKSGKKQAMVHRFLNIFKIKYCTPAALWHRIAKF